MIIKPCIGENITVNVRRYPSPRVLKNQLRHRVCGCLPVPRAPRLIQKKRAGINCGNNIGPVILEVILEQGN